MTATVPLFALAEELLAEAREAASGRAARTVFGGRGRTMRQTLIAVTEGAGLAEHEAPHEATLLVVTGGVQLRAGDHAWPLRAGDHAEIPQERHSVHATEDSVFLLTAVPEAPRGD